MKPKIALLILDIDNTLFDWFEYWYRTFNPIYKLLVSNLNINENELKAHIKKIHKKYGTSEVPWFGSELLQDLNGREYNILIEEIRKQEKLILNMKLEAYPEVIKTLKSIKSTKVKLVGYSESNEFQTITRINKLGLAGILDCIYCHPNTGETFYEANSLHLKDTDIEYIERGTKKPNSRVICEILTKYKVFPDQVAFVGDSLTRDIVMAQNTNVTDIYAKYGVARNRDEYDLLRGVTHWQEDEVSQEKAMDQSIEIKPKFILENSFNEIENHIEFVSREFMFDFKKDDILSLYMSSIDVMKHFNDLQLKVRSMGLTLLTAFLALSSFTIDKDVHIVIFCRDVSVTFLIFTLSTFILFGTWFLDKFVYQRLLKGTVSHAYGIEKKYMDRIPELNMSISIGEASKVKFLGVNLDSNKKINIFYGVILSILLILSIVMFFSEITVTK